MITEEFKAWWMKQTPDEKQEQIIDHLNILKKHHGNPKNKKKIPETASEFERNIEKSFQKINRRLYRSMRKHLKYMIGTTITN